MKIDRQIPALFKKRKTWIAILVSFLLIWGLFHACSTKKKPASKIYTIARNSRWYPLSQINKERSMQGFVDDLLSEIAKEENFKFYWIETNSEPLLEGLSNRDYDAILSFLKPSPMTRERYDFSDLIYRTGPVLVVARDSPIKSINDLNGKIIGIQSGLTLAFNAIMKNPKDSNYLLTTYDNMPRALEMLISNQIDALIMGVIPAYTYILTFYPEKLRIITQPLTDDGFRLVTLKEQTTEDPLVKRFDEGLKKLKENRMYESLLFKWGLLDPERLLTEE